jgi:hypothetical protein
MTLLDMTQNILSAIKGDRVNSIGDTSQAEAVAQEIKTAYYTLLEQQDQPYQKGALQIEANQDLTRPTHMTIPENVKQIDWIKYNDRKSGKNNYVNVEYLDPEDWLLRSVGMAGQTNILEVTDASGVKIYIATDQAPKYYTTFDEQTLIFDAYNSSLENTLQETNTIAWGYTVPAWRMTDDFVPKLRVDLFPLLLAEAKSACFTNLKQVASTKDEQRARRLITQHQNRNHRLAEKRKTSKGPDYSRP